MFFQYYQQKISSFNGKGVYKYKDGKWYVYKEEDYSNLSFGSKSEADDYIKKHLSPTGKFLVKYYHDGLENGLVDFSKKDSNFDLVQKYGLKKYEVPAILKQGEAVMNQEQIKNLATMKYKVYDGITKNLSDVTLNTMDDAESLIDILKWLAIESNIKHNYIVVPQVEIEIKLQGMQKLIYIPYFLRFFLFYYLIFRFINNNLISL